MKRHDLPVHAELPLYRSILLALDSSDHSNRSTQEAVALAGLSEATVTGAHVYAAKLHDLRFRQMEGGLPKAYREEAELERQRDVHDDLITRGLSVITDSYLDQAERRCQEAKVNFARRSLEGKNYQALASEANGGDYDLLVMGALGVGAVQGSRLGTVCQRVLRRARLDTLVVRDPKKDISDGPIVVAVDGSPRSFGGLLTALALARHWRVSVHVVAAFDPYFHYVAFQRIAGVLSEEASKVFRFEEQEKLHEDIIDSGLAKIYQGHLQVSKTIAAEYGIEIFTELLSGKPNEALQKYVVDRNASLLVMGRLGVHADSELDIGGNAEHLVREAHCAVLLSERQHQPALDVVADATTSWTQEADQAMEHVPSFVRNMARVAILRHAQQRGHTVITASIVRDVTNELCPGRGAHSEKVRPGATWSEPAQALLQTVQDVSVRENVKCRAEKRAREDGTQDVSLDHVLSFLSPSTKADQDDERHASRASQEPEKPARQGDMLWSRGAKERIELVPEGMARDMTRKVLTTLAQESGLKIIDIDFVEQVLATFGSGSAKVCESLVWEKTARKRLSRAPKTVQGMLVREVEGWARRNGLDRVDCAAVETVKALWKKKGHFHLDPGDPRSAR